MTQNEISTIIVVIVVTNPCFLCLFYFSLEHLPNVKTRFSLRSTNKMYVSHCVKMCNHLLLLVVVVLYSLLCWFVCPILLSLFQIKQQTIGTMWPQMWWLALCVLNEWKRVFCEFINIWPSFAFLSISQLYDVLLLLRPRQYYMAVLLPDIIKSQRKNKKIMFKHFT